jgi:CubicO group peptidase (beta-lactamase class C family)
MYFPEPGSGFGLGLAVRTVDESPFPAGEYRWDGVGDTFFLVDPSDDMSCIVMMQSPSQSGRIQAEVKTIIYEALAQ